MGRLSVCIISKYPPIQGGMAAAAYWLARGLGDAGLDVHVVTDGNLVEPEYCIMGDYNEECPGVTVHYVSNEMPWHIPYGEHRLPKLIDTALSVCRETRIDVIDGQYLVPYGFAGSIVSSFTGIPYVVRHGGSDISKFLKGGHFEFLIRRTLQMAAAVITNSPDVAGYSSSAVSIPRYVPDQRQFYPGPKTTGSLTCAYIGKINYYWRHKGLHKLAEMVTGSDIRIIYLAQGKGKDNYVRTCNPGSSFIDFIHPSKMPNFLRGIDYLFYFVGDSPLVDISNLVLESVSVGVPILTDRKDLFGQYRDYFDVDKWVIEVESSLSGQEFTGFLQTLKRSEQTGLAVKYEDFIENNEALYEDISERCSFK